MKEATNDSPEDVATQSITIGKYVLSTDDVDGDGKSDFVNISSGSATLTISTSRLGRWAAVLVSSITAIVLACSELGIAQV